jgi:alkyl sulfatase BDS1-like metallo-beta-lactamase superfamily hydrolase
MANDQSLPNGPKPASPATARANADVGKALGISSSSRSGTGRGGTGSGSDTGLSGAEPAGDVVAATRGLVAALPVEPVTNSWGWPVWDPASMAFAGDGPAPDTVNPSLWRHAGLNANAGLFEVTDGIWQVRGLDLSNMTLVAGDTGWIVIDPLSTAETATAALALANEHLGDRPVRAVIYTHSHVDHYGGVRGVINDDDVRNGVEVLAPAGFLEAAVAENVVAGTAMSRRATYMYGILLPRNPNGHVDCGLGRATPVMGSVGLIAPTSEITHTGEVRVVDGVAIEFHLTPGTEAPAEMNFLFPEHRALCMAENCTATLHNIYTPRGAVVRDALAWSTYIDEAIERFDGRADVAFASHHWPAFGPAAWRAWLTAQRDAYRYLHDQTLRWVNHGLAADEIAERVDLPPSLAHQFHLRDYYGTVRHNVRGIVQRYLGWFDANPATLNPHPRTERARRYVAAMGGADAVLAQARDSFDDGDYRWVAEIVNHVVFADPTNDAARHLQADALEQLGYQSESSVWRDFYLTGAQELRVGHHTGRSRGTASVDTVAAMTPAMLLTYLGVHIDGPAAASVGDLRLTLELTDDVTWSVGLSNGALYATPGRRDDGAVATVRASTSALADLVFDPEPATAARLVADGQLTVDGDSEALDRLLGVCDAFDMWFPIVEPSPRLGDER